MIEKFDAVRIIAVVTADADLKIRTGSCDPF
jgi:hypothetical protein